MYWNYVNAIGITRVSRLTLTWDVLKCNCNFWQGNRNRININMRCIEIALYQLHFAIHQRLTLTWDVLKFVFYAILQFMMPD